MGQKEEGNGDRGASWWDFGRTLLCTSQKEDLIIWPNVVTSFIMTLSISLQFIL